MFSWPSLVGIPLVPVSLPCFSITQKPRPLRPCPPPPPGPPPPYPPPAIPTEKPSRWGTGTLSSTDSHPVSHIPDLIIQEWPWPKHWPPLIVLDLGRASKFYCFLSWSITDPALLPSFFLASWIDAPLPFTPEEWHLFDFNTQFLSGHQSSYVCWKFDWVLSSWGYSVLWCCELLLWLLRV